MLKRCLKQMHKLLLIKNAIDCLITLFTCHIKKCTFQIENFEHIKMSEGFILGQTFCCYTTYGQNLFL